MHLKEAVASGFHMLWAHLLEGMHASWRQMWSHGLRALRSHALRIRAHDKAAPRQMAWSESGAVNLLHDDLHQSMLPQDGASRQIQLNQSWSGLSWVHRLPGFGASCALRIRCCLPVLARPNAIPDGYQSKRLDLHQAQSRRTRRD